MREIAEGSIPHPSQEPHLLKSKENLKSRSTFVVPSQAPLQAGLPKVAKFGIYFRVGTGLWMSRRP